MQRFLQEQEDSAPAAEAAAAATEDGAEGAAEGRGDDGAKVYLLVAGAVDTDTVAKKANRDGSRDLRRAHILELPGKVAVSKVFSGPIASHSVAVDAQGRAYAWGWNREGQLGVDSPNEMVYAPTPVVGADRKTVVRASCGRHHTGLVCSDGALLTCGLNADGQLGLGRSSKAPARRFAAAPFSGRCADVACGMNFTLACGADGRLWSCGFPEHGVLGLGSEGKRLERAGKYTFDAASAFTAISVFLEVEKVPGGRRIESAIQPPPKIAQVRCGREHCLALESHSTAGKGKPRLFSWGFGGYGRLGHRDQDTELRPRLVAELDQPRHLSVASIECGASCSMAVDTRGALYYWGKIPKAQRGEATMYPTMVPDLMNWKTSSASAGAEAVQVAAEGAVVSWGGQPCGEMALGEDGPKSQIRAAINAELGESWSVSEVASGYAHALFLATAKDDDVEDEQPTFKPPEPKPPVEVKKRGAGGGRGGKAKRGRKAR